MVTTSISIHVLCIVYFFIFCVLQMLQKMNDDRTLIGILGPFLVAIVTFILRLILP